MCIRDRSKSDPICVFHYGRISHFCSRDVDRDPMILYELDLHILTMYLHTKLDFLNQGFQKLELEQDRHTDKLNRINFGVLFSVPV